MIATERNCIRPRNQPGSIPCATLGPRLGGMAESSAGPRPVASGRWLETPSCARVSRPRTREKVRFECTTKTQRALRRTHKPGAMATSSWQCVSESSHAHGRRGDPWAWHPNKTLLIFSIFRVSCFRIPLSSIALRVSSVWPIFPGLDKLYPPSPACLVEQMAGLASASLVAISTADCKLAPR